MGQNRFEIIEESDRSIFHEEIGNYKKNKVFLYGGGNAGKLTHSFLEDMDISIEGIIDKNADNIKAVSDIKIMSPKYFELNVSKECIVIVSFLCNKDEFDFQKARLSDMGVKKVVYFHDIFNLRMLNNYLMESTSNSMKDNLTTMPADITKISFAYSLLEDEKSKNIFLNFIEGILTINSNKFSLPDEEIQYFPNDISFQRGYQRFVDCGSYNGDTILELNRIIGKVEKIACFEPEPSNYLKLIDTIHCHDIAEESLCFEYGVWDKFETLRFKDKQNGASGISTSGELEIQCAPIDETLKDFKPTFIKMDIEGAELKALLGAKETISKLKPDLAISVYHNLKDIWEIPLLIQSYNSEYKIYFKSHGLHGMETIMYATCSK